MKGLLQNNLENISELYPTFYTQPIALPAETHIYNDMKMLGQDYHTLFQWWQSLNNIKMGNDIANIFVNWVCIESEVGCGLFLGIELPNAATRKYIPISTLDRQIAEGLWRKLDVNLIDLDIQRAIEETNL